MIVRWKLLRYNAGQPAAEGYVLSLQDDAGNSGLGEARAISGFGSGPEVLKTFLSKPDNVTGLLRSLQQGRQISTASGNTPVPPEALFAAETAMHDLAARITGQDLTSWLGYRPRAWLANSQLVSDEQQARQLASQGHRNFKLKAGGNSSAWVGLFELLRSATQGQARIRVDANQAWDLDTAQRMLGQVELDNLAYVEQPFPAGDLDSCRKLKDAMGISIAIDEGAPDTASIEEIAAAGAADLVVIKPMFRGLAGSLDLAAAAEANSLGVCITHSMDGTIGRLAAMHLAATIDGQWPHGLYAPGLPILADEPRLEPDRLFMPTGPGLGCKHLRNDVLQAWSEDQ